MVGSCVLEACARRDTDSIQIGKGSVCVGLGCRNAEGSFVLNAPCVGTV
jgi:hypothetical protein